MSFSSSHSIAFTKWLISKLPVSSGLGTANNIGQAFWDEFLATEEFARVPMHTIPVEPAPKCVENMQAIINKGTGAGGAKTNENGLPYEELTDLKDRYKSCDLNKEHNAYEVQFEGYDRKFVKAPKSVLHKYMKQIGENNPELKPAPGCKEPDEAYIDPEKRIAFIIEKKFQQTSGSVDEKIQTGHFKKFQYERLFPNFKIYYVYCLSEWFKKDEYKSTLIYLRENGIPIFWGSSETYKDDIIKFMHNSL
jgi:hypothetical protein